MNQEGNKLKNHINRDPNFSRDNILKLFIILFHFQIQKLEDVNLNHHNFQNNSNIMFFNHFQKSNPCK